jgi:geranylgeranyl diphosphate synthase, type I
MPSPLLRGAFLDEVALRAERTGQWLLAEEHNPVVSLSRLRETTRAYVARPGKRLRPAVLLFACAAVGGNEEQALPAAAAVELFHTWSLVHDDIIDNDDLRRGQPTAHRLAGTLAAEQLGLAPAAAAHYGQSAAILAGDIQLAWAMRMLVRCRDQGVSADVVLDLMARLTDQLAPQLIDGEMLDVEFSHRPPDELSEGEILNMQELKTGALLGYAASTGASIGTGRVYNDCPEARALNAFGRACGIAFQLQDDILGIVGDERQLGKPIGSDLREGKATVLILHALRHANGRDGDLLRRVLGNPQAPADEVAKATQLLTYLGSLEHTRVLARQYIAGAREHLAELPPSPSRDLLEAWGEFLFDRKF